MSETRTATPKRARAAKSEGLSVGEHGLVLRSLEDLLAFAKLAKEGGAVPEDMNEAAAAIAIQAGLERGLGPLGGLRACIVVNGQMSWRGQAAVALIRNSGTCVPGTWRQGTTGEGDKAVGYAEAQRVGYAEPIRVEFSVADARRAGLWGTSAFWTEYPGRQLMWRAVSHMVKDNFSDVSGGFPLAEEARDYRAPAAPRAERPAAPAPIATPAPDPLLDAIESAPAPEPTPSPAEEPGAAEAAEIFEPAPEPELVEEPPAEIPPPAVIAGSIQELKAKLAASIAPIEARTKPGCDHPQAITHVGSSTKVCTTCGEEIPVVAPDLVLLPPAPKRRSSKLVR